MVEAVIRGTRDDLKAVGTFVLPAEDGSYACPPAPCINTFWAYRRDENGKVIVDDNDMILRYVTVDPVTMVVVDPTVKDVTANMIGEWISTRLHPNFI
jgi:hypothetical protein